MLEGATTAATCIFHDIPLRREPQGNMHAVIDQPLKIQLALDRYFQWAGSQQMLATWTG